MKRISVMALTVVALLAVGALASLGFVSKAAAEIKAVIVEILLPTKPFSASSANLGGDLWGPGTGTFGITNITVTNLRSDITGSVLILVPNSCIQADINVSYTVLELAVPPNSTTVLPFPSPLVINKFHLAPSTPPFNTACIQVIPNAVGVLIVGYSE